MTASPAAMETVAAPWLHKLTQELFSRSGMSAGDAAIIADHLVRAELRGMGWMGARKIPQYLARLRAGGTSPDAAPEVTRRSGGMLAVDGHDGFGQVICYHTMKMVIAEARSNGLAAAVVCNTTSAGALGVFASQAAEERLIGMAINNGPPIMAAPGGAERLVGNQAFALASPAGRHRPVLFDSALSAMTWVRMYDYRLRGEPLPEGIAVTAEGEPTTDPVAGQKGILAPTSGHRGFGLALMWEILTGILSGAEAFFTTAGADSPEQPDGVSVFLLAIDPTAILPYDAFVERVDTLIDTVHGSRPLPGTSRITVPGERSAELSDKRETDGIPIAADVLAELRAVAADLGVTL